jgi:integrase
MHNDAQALKQFLSWCADRNLIDVNPLASRKFSPPKYKPREGPTLEQINSVLGATSETRYPVLATLAFTGARSGEVAHLRVEDVDLIGNWLHFESRPGFETKTGESRKVPIHARLRPVIENALKRNKDGWLFTAQPSRKFPPGDHHISTKRLNEDLQKVLKKVEMPTGHEAGFTVHSLRRSFKTICINSNVPREVVDAWQGHACIRTASDMYYSLPDEESQRFMTLVPFGDSK